MYKTVPASHSEEEYYSPDDFIKAPKIDAHLHYDTSDDSYLVYADSINMHLISINVDTGLSIDEQLSVSQSLKKKHPDKYNFFGTFSSAEIKDDQFAKNTIERIKKCMDTGAKGIKIWKNIGMVLQDENGKYIMADDPVFYPLYDFLEKEGIPLLAHLGEPRNCWLSYNDITTYGDLQYYMNYPEYHMYYNDKVPSYEQQIAARDHLLEIFPRLKFVGAHLGSLEWDIDEAAKRLDRYPEFCVDLSARMGHIHLQTIRDSEKVRNFFIKYKDRLLYGSDCFITGKNTSFKSIILQMIAPDLFVKRICKIVYRTWLNDWLFFATDETVLSEKYNTENTSEAVKGLRLPKHIVDGIFYKTACNIYHIHPAFSH